MKSIIKLLFLSVIAIIAATSCSKDEFTETIFDTSDKALDQTSYTFPLDSFIKREFLQPYNLRFIYKMEDVGSDMDKNLTPAPYENSVQLAVLSKYLWYDCYKELAGEHEVFLKKYSPRIIHVIGSKSYNPSQGTETLGVAEGGLKITLTNVNNLNVEDIAMMNEYFFKTMHHEFAHILDQTHIRPSAFNLVSNGMYDSMGWSDTPDSVSCGNGFVSPYASSAVGEDWVENLAVYVTADSITWNNMLNTAKYDWELVDCDSYDSYAKKCKPGCNLDTIGYYKAQDNGESKIYRRCYLRDENDNIVLDENGQPQALETNGFVGTDVILKKIDYVRTWLKDYYQIDLDELRNMVQERMYVKNADGTWAKDWSGNLVNKLTQSVEGYDRLIDQLTDQVYSLKKN